MKLTFETPEIEVVEIVATDILTNSNFGNADFTKKPDQNWVWDDEE